MQTYDVFYAVWNKVEIQANTSEEATDIVRQQVQEQIGRSDIIDVRVAIDGTNQTNTSNR